MKEYNNKVTGNTGIEQNKKPVFTWNAHPPKASSYLLATDASVFPTLLVSRHNENRRMPCEWGSDICRREVFKKDVL